MLELLTSKEAIAKLRITPKTFYGLVENGTIPARKIGKEWRVSEAALERMFDGEVEVASGSQGTEGRTAHQ